MPPPSDDPIQFAKYLKKQKEDAEKRRAQWLIEDREDRRVRNNLFENWMRPALHRMITDSGIARVSRRAPQHLAIDATKYLLKILKEAIAAAKEAKRSTIKPEDVLRTINKYDGPFLGNKDVLYFPKTTFDRSVRQYAKAIEPNIRFSPEVFPLIQKFLEAQILTTINLSKTAMQHARRNTLFEKDIWLVLDSMMFCPIADK